MKLLHAIYASPAVLLAKAKRDGDRLAKALRDCDEPGMRDTLFNFAISAYHVADWIKAYRPDLKSPVDALLRGSDSIRACRDLCNASKHVKLNLTRGSYVMHPPVIGEVAISAPATTILMNPASRPHWKLKIQLKSGRRYPAEDLVAEAISEWETFFAQNHVR